jgi:hypothetical protein
MPEVALQFKVALQVAVWEPMRQQLIRHPKEGHGVSFAW